MGATWFWPDIQSDFAQLIAVGTARHTPGSPGDMLYERQTDTPAQRYPAYDTSPASFRLKGCRR
jgi:hypothetical protein